MGLPPHDSIGGTGSRAIGSVPSIAVDESIRMTHDTTEAKLEWIRSELAAGVREHIAETLATPWERRVPARRGATIERAAV